MIHAIVGRARTLEGKLAEEALFRIDLTQETEVGRDDDAPVPRYDAVRHRISFPRKSVLDLAIEPHHGRIQVEDGRAWYVHTAATKMFTVAYDAEDGTLKVAEYPGDVLELSSSERPGFSPYLLLGDATDPDWNPKTAIDSLSDFETQYFIRLLRD